MHSLLAAINNVILSVALVLSVVAVVRKVEGGVP
jgi:hypothetical protein